MNCADWIQVATQVITTITAVVMAKLAYMTYLQPPEQSSEAEPEEALDESADERIREIMVFDTSKQKTWLSVTPQGLHCRIIDTRPGKGGPQWTLSKDQTKQILASRSFHVNPGYKVKTGTFTLGPRRSWLYTKALFPEAEYLLGVLQQLLEGASS